MAGNSTDIFLRIKVDVTNVQAVARLTSEIDKQRAKILQLQTANKTFGRQYTGLLGVFKKFSAKLWEAERAMDALFRAGVHLQAMGRDLFGFFKGAVGVVSKMVAAWGEFEFTLNRAAAASDIFGNTKPMYGKLKEAVFDLARELRVFPAEEVAKGLYFWQSTTGEVIETQQDLERTMESVSAVMKVAAMTDTNYETAIKGVYSTLKQFNMTTKDTADVSALLFYATQKTALEFPDLINSFKMTGAVAGNANEPLKTMVAILGAVGNAGFRGSQAGRALRQTYIKIVKPTAQAKEKLDELFKAQGGYNKVAFDAKGNFIGMEKYITKLAKATKGMTYQQKANLLATITTANELPVMTQMLRMADAAVKDGSKSWIDFVLTQEKANESFRESWDILANSWRGVVGLLKQTVEPIMLRIGEMIAKRLTPILTEFADIIWGMQDTFQEVAEEIMKALEPVIVWVERAGKKVLKWVKDNPKIVKQIAVWAALGTVIAGVVGAVMLAAGMFIYLLSTTVLVVSGMTGMLLTFAGFITIIVAFATKWYQNVNGIRDATSKFVQAITGLFNRMFGGIEGAKKGFGGFANLFGDNIDSILKSLAEWLNKIADAINRLSDEEVQRVKDFATSLFKLLLLRKTLAMFGITLTNVGKSLHTFGKALVVAGKAAQFLAKMNMGSLLVTLARGVWTLASAVAGLVIAGGPVVWIIAAIIAAVTALVIAYETNFMGFKDFVDGIINWFINEALPAIMSFIDGIATFVGEVVANIGGFVETVIQTVQGIVDFFANLPENIGNFIQQVIDAIAAFVGNILETVGNFLADLAENWFYYLGYILGVIISFPIKVLIEIVKFGINLISAIVDFLSKLPGRFADWFGKVWDNLSTWFIKTIGDVAEWAGDMIGKIVDWFVKLPGRILNWLGEVWDTLSTWFINTAIDIGKWAGDMVQKVIDFFIALPGNLIKAVKDFPGQLQKWFEDLVSTAGKVWNAIVNVGKDIVKGIWEGIKNMVGWFTKQVENFFKGIIDGVKDTLGIGSPSKVFAEMGGFMMEGLVVGINGAAKDVYRSMDNLTTGLTEMAAKSINPISAELSGIAVGGDFNYVKSAETTKSIDLNVNVTSGDGSVSALDMTTLSQLITGSDMVRALEQMATVD